MDRFQKKCVVASTGFHLLLVLILFVGPAFLSAPQKSEPIKDLNFVPTKLVDALVSGGGSPKAAASPPPQLAPAATSAPQPTREPAKPKEPVREVKESTPPVETPDPIKKPKLSAQSLTMVTRKQQASKVRSKPTADTHAQETADSRQELSDLIRRTATGIARGTASATKVDDPEGPGGGGESYASYEAWVRDVYERAWVRPDQSTTDEPITKVSITVGKDGRVISSRIVKRSGDAQMDASVQRTLDRVNSVGRPFPEGAKDSERTYIIPFNMKKQLGQA